jgi:hypothetical protein
MQWPWVRLASRTLRQSSVQVRSSGLDWRRVAIDILLNWLCPLRCIGVYYWKAILHMFLGGDKRIVRTERVIAGWKKGYEGRTLDSLPSGRLTQ